MNKLNSSKIKIKLGIICSSGASIIFENLKFFKENNIKLYFAFDRECQAKKLSKKYKIPFMIRNFDETFCEKVKIYFKKNNIKNIVTIFTRAVDKNIYKEFNSFNIHPSFLPKYKGLYSLKRQIENKEKYLGCSLHRLTKKLDSGKIIHQIKSSYNKKNYKKISFLQKIYLVSFLVIFIKKYKIQKKEIIYINKYFNKNFEKKYNLKIL